MAEGHGGRRTPRNPAPVSNVRSGARTDGGAGSKKQPLRVATGGGYGAAKAQVDQQQGAPLPVDPNSVAPVGGSAAGGAGVQAAQQIPELGAPTTRPQEPATAGAVMPGQEPDVEMTLRALYDKFPSPWIGRLIRD